MGGDRVAAAPAAKMGNELTLFLKTVEPSMPQVLLGHDFVHRKGLIKHS